MKQKAPLLSKLLLFYLLLACLVFPVGCWDRREPNLLGIVTTVAFDFDPQTELLHLIARVANPIGVTAGSEDGSGGGSNGKNPFWTVETSGQTVYEAIKKTEQTSTKKLIWSHLEVVLFSETMAKEGLWPILDYFDRERQARLIVRPFVVKGDIRELVQANFPLELFGGPALARQLTTLRLEDAVTPEIDTLRQLFFHLAEPGMELALPLLEVQVKKENGAGSGGGGSGPKPDDPNPAKISGAALFRGDKLVDYFNEKETAGYLWITNNVRRLTMAFPCLKNSDKYQTVEIFEVSTKLEPQVQEGKIRLHLFIHAEGRLQDFTCTSLPKPPDIEHKSSLERGMAREIRKQINMAWQKGRTLNLDVFDFGHLLFQKKPKDWQDLEKRWEEIFPEIELEVDVQTVIRSYGLVTEPLKIR